MSKPSVIDERLIREYARAQPSIWNSEGWITIATRTGEWDTAILKWEAGGRPKSFDKSKAGRSLAAGQRVRENLRQEAEERKEREQVIDVEAKILGGSLGEPPNALSGESEVCRV